MSRGIKYGLKENLSVIQFIKKLWKIPWIIDALILIASEDLKKFEVVHIAHVVREANRVADWMTHQGYFTSSLSYCFDSPNIFFSVIILKNTLG